MPHNHEWQSRLKAVEREYVAMRQATDRFLRHDDPTILHNDLRHGEIVEAWAKVEAGSPVLIVMTISDAFYMPDGDGVANFAEAPDPARRHAVVALATGELAEVKCLLARNSWGETWGLHGHAWLAESYLKPRISLMYTMK